MQDVVISLRLFILSFLICSVAYPTVILGFAALAAPHARQGSLLTTKDGTLVGSRLLAQEFTRPEYFWPRPSACNYDASATGGSNLSPTSPQLTERAQHVIGQLQPHEGELVPADLVSASGSGMDPHISLAAAMLQAPRVAASRQVSVEQLHELIQRHVDSPALALLEGEPLINVLVLNLALDRAGTANHKP